MWLTTGEDVILSRTRAQLRQTIGHLGVGRAKRDEMNLIKNPDPPSPLILSQNLAGKYAPNLFRHKAKAA